jgi:hypothetical protein
MKLWPEDPLTSAVAGTIALFVVIIVLIVYTVIAMRTCFHRRFLDGLWEADYEFAKDANVASFMMYFKGPSSSRWPWARVGKTCYVLIVDVDGEIIESQAYDVTVQHNSLSGVSGLLKLHINYPGDKTHPIPANTNMHLDLLNGKLTLKAPDADGEMTTYAELFKNNHMTDFGKAEVTEVVDSASF